MTDAPAPEYFGRDLEAMDFAHNYHSWILDEIRPFIGSEIAEVGAGSGSFSQLLLGTCKCHLTAYEPSSNMFAVLKSRLANNSQAKAVNDFFKPGQTGFDSLLYINVLEHIGQDKEELKTAFDALKSGGYLIIFVPALKALFSDFDRQIGHFRRYSLVELKAKVNAASFEIVTARFFDILGVLPWFVNFVLLKRPMNASAVKLYDRLIVPIASKAETLVKPPIGKNILLIARKPTL